MTSIDSIDLLWVSLPLCLISLYLFRLKKRINKLCFHMHKIRPCCNRKKKPLISHIEASGISYISERVVSLFVIYHVNPRQQELTFMDITLHRLGCGDNGHPFLNILHCSIALFAEHL